MTLLITTKWSLSVAPARERGLKFRLNSAGEVMYCRSREGAWIEITVLTSVSVIDTVAPARERGLKSPLSIARQATRSVAPARERGLKFRMGSAFQPEACVAPARERGLKFIYDSL